MSAVAFFSALYGDSLPPGQHLTLWRGDTKQTIWLSGYGGVQAAIEAAKQAAGADLYFGVALRGEEKPGRGTDDDVVALPGLWLDLDLAEGAGRKKSKKKYPPRDVADRVLLDLPVAPSMIVETGGGWHVYWLFAELLELRDAAARERARQLTGGWQRFVAERLKETGEYTIDATHDLARVLRVPGSWNRKHGRECTIVDAERLDVVSRYLPGDFAPHLLAAAPEPGRPLLGGQAGNDTTGTPYVVGQLVLSADANPPVELLEATCFNSPEFTKIWRHKKNYDSNSERELAMAHYCVLAGWTDQQIANLFAAHRRLYEPGKVEKILRIDYVAGTICKARQGVREDTAVHELSRGGGVAEPTLPNSTEQAAAGGAADPPPIRSLPVGPATEAAVHEGNGKPTPEEVSMGGAGPQQRAAILASLKQFTGLDVAGWRQYGREKAVYSLVIGGDHEIEIGTTESLTANENAFRSRVYEQTGVLIPVVKRSKWWEIVRTLGKIVEVIDDSETQVAEQTKAHVREWLERRDRYTADQKYEACRLRAPFVENGRVHFRLPDFVRWLGFRANERIAERRMAVLLRRVGGRPETINYRKEDDSWSTVRYWSINEPS